MSNIRDICNVCGNISFVPIRGMQGEAEHHAIIFLLPALPRQHLNDLWLCIREQLHVLLRMQLQHKAWHNLGHAAILLQHRSSKSKCADHPTILKSDK